MALVELFIPTPLGIKGSHNLSQAEFLKSTVEELLQEENIVSHLSKI